MCIAFGRLEVTSSGRNLLLTFMDAHFDYEESVFVEAPSSQPSPQKKRVAQPEVPLFFENGSGACDRVVDREK